MKSNAIPAANKPSCKIKSFFNFGTCSFSILPSKGYGASFLSSTCYGASVLPSYLRPTNVQSSAHAPAPNAVPITVGASTIRRNKDTTLLLQPIFSMKFQKACTKMGISLTSLQVLFPIQNPLRPERRPKVQLLADISGLSPASSAVKIDVLVISPRARQNHGNHFALNFIKLDGNGFLERPPTELP